MATYNRASLVTRAIKSVIDQSFNDWEFIIVDDASNDETSRILSEWQKKEKRIKIIRNEINLWRDKGLAGNLNKAIKEARGKYIARIDDDDHWINSDKLKKQVEFLEQNPDYVLTLSHGHKEQASKVFDEEFKKDIWQQTNAVKNRKTYALDDKKFPVTGNINVAETTKALKDLLIKGDTTQ